jgi:hypothetical protein
MVSRLQKSKGIRNKEVGAKTYQSQMLSIK